MQQSQTKYTENTGTSAIRTDLQYHQRKEYRQKKLRGLSPQATMPTERPPPVGEVSANFCG
jgi:hypothetical protein